MSDKRKWQESWGKHHVQTTRKFARRPAENPIQKRNRHHRIFGCVLRLGIPLRESHNFLGSINSTRLYGVLTIKIVFYKNKNYNKSRNIPKMYYHFSKPLEIKKQRNSNMSSYFFIQAIVKNTIKKYLILSLFC